jgi:hypothetical protein
MPDDPPAEGGLMRWTEPPPGGCTIPWSAVQRIRIERPSLHIEDLLLMLSLGFAARFTGEQCQVIAGEIRSLRMQLRQPYPGRTDETERAFEGDTMNDRLDPRSPAFRLGTIPNPNGPGVVELDPTCCYHGHPLNPGTCTRGWQPCGCGGHRSWRCWHTLDDQLDGQLCGDVVLWPPRGEQCTPVGGYGTGGSP